MTQYRKARVTIYADVFVPVGEIEGLIDLVKGDDEGTLTEPEAFEKLALDKINALFPTDDPLRVREVDIDMETFE